LIACGTETVTVHGPSVSRTHTTPPVAAVVLPVHKLNHVSGVFSASQRRISLELL